ncbi:MAG TPA: iron-containing redox enzyme family protein [Nitrososphaerales archaeon]|nr:iron-containing redox enzyme family protein [Nitrososphaerales archaeon]
MTKCSMCGQTFPVGDYDALGQHYFDFAEKSDIAHVMWLNRYVTRKKTKDAKELSKLLAQYFDLGQTNGNLQKWLRLRFIDRFYGSRPHPFVVALQHPSKSILLGYVIEHQHFLKQWVRSCAYIVAKTDQTDATLYELDNINTEFGGIGTERPAHYELLLKMGESLGMDRQKILSTPSLPDTASSIRSWDDLARTEHWVETMAAMHGLELIADRTLREDGATISYFDPMILKPGSHEVTEETKDFLREGYEADVGHSKEALDLVEKYAKELNLIENVQATFLKSIDIFHRYLMARLQRAEEFDSA